MKITDDMLTDSRILKLVRRVLIDGNDKDKLSSASFLKFARAIEREVAGRRTTPDREAIIEECAKEADYFSASSGVARNIGNNIRALKVAPTTNNVAWISVDDRLPEAHTFWLVCAETDEGPTVQSMYFDGKNWIHEGEPTFCHSYMLSPTHWMPLPAAPTSDKGDA
ncbi:DUF551 domain-containing protein [Burkholderia cepacia]|uniref:DUF551 domain-containing protein n=1 Tax=Burkholderia cepacia TaxID=292 RepID=UPI001F3A4848|nr:DUF551 domain-containing protein [Burkholderia cepacia]UIY60037.1 DUF551 domain-containing protein [Burkholderia cepacia]